MVKKIAVLLISVLISSCGGDDGNPSAPLVVLDTENIRTYVQGDSLEATYTARYTSLGQSATGNVTATIGGIVQNPFGIDCRLVIYSGTLTGSAGTIAYSVRSLFYQDSNSSLYDCGEFDEDLGRYVFLTDTASTPDGVFLESKSPMKIGDSTSGVLYFDDGTWEDCTETVVAIETVNIPLGKFESYKKNQSCSYSDGDVLESTIWTVPSIFDIKESGVINDIVLELEVISYAFVE